MGSAQVVRVGDVGTKLEIQVFDGCVVVDISAATSVAITIKRPDGTTVTKKGVLSSNGVDGKSYFLTDANDLTMRNKYSIQAKVTLPKWAGYTSIEEFTVEDNL